MGDYSLVSKEQENDDLYTDHKETGTFGIKLQNGIIMNHLEIEKADNKTEVRRENLQVEIEKVDNLTDDKLLYKVTDTVPVHLLLLFVLQQALLSLSLNLVVSLLVAEVVCAEKNAEYKTKLLSSTMFMSGLTTLLQVTVGIRLPFYQGPILEYTAPLLAMAAFNKGKCIFDVSALNETSEMLNGTSNISVMNPVTMETNEEEVILNNLRALQGSLLAAGFIHMSLGATGLVGLLVKVVGSVTVVPSILLIGINLTKTVTRFSQVHWGVSLTTCTIAIILSLYLAKNKMPILIWTKKKSWHVIWYPLHQVFAILIALVVGWILCVIFTESNVFSTSSNHTDYKARTDKSIDSIQKAEWFYFPYPGQFGVPSFSISAFVGFLIATVISVLDSVADYYACASLCKEPAPPSHAINRGISVEGFCTTLAGIVGCGHGTSTIGANIGAVGLTKVASRSIFVGVGILYMLFGVFSKLAALFINIPLPVLGGVLIVMFGSFNGVVLSNLKFIDISSSRNVTIIGTALLFGLMIPQWVNDYPGAINTGNDDADNVIELLLGNPNLAGTVLACLLDNTVPGTKLERGIIAWQPRKFNTSDNSRNINEYQIYDPLLPSCIQRSKFMKYVPFLPDPVQPEKNPNTARVSNCI